MRALLDQDNELKVQHRSAYWSFASQMDQESLHLYIYIYGKFIQYLKKICLIQL